MYKKKYHYYIMTTIPIRIDDADLKKIEYLVKKGLYKNRSQAIKKLLIEGLQQELMPFEWKKESNKESRIKIINKLSSIESFSFSNKSTKSAEDIIGEERGRF